jgi:hypothetical protein
MPQKDLKNKRRKLFHANYRPQVDISLGPNHALTPLSCALSGKGTNTIFIVIVWSDYAKTTTSHQLYKQIR